MSEDNIFRLGACVNAQWDVAELRDAIQHLGNL